MPHPAGVVPGLLPETPGILPRIPEKLPGMDLHAALVLLPEMTGMLDGTDHPGMVPQEMAPLGMALHPSGALTPHLQQGVDLGGRSGIVEFLMRRSAAKHSILQPWPPIVDITSPNQSICQILPGLCCSLECA